VDEIGICGSKGDATPPPTQSPLHHLGIRMQYKITVIEHIIINWTRTLALGSHSTWTTASVTTRKLTNYAPQRERSDIDSYLISRRNVLVRFLSVVLKGTETTTTSFVRILRLPVPAGRSSSIYRRMIIIQTLLRLLCKEIIF
jgi:hypothetical protein